jgi:hypothetical protein
MKVVPFMMLPRFVGDALVLRYAIPVLCGGVTLGGRFQIQRPNVHRVSL